MRVSKAADGATAASMRIAGGTCLSACSFERASVPTANARIDDEQETDSCAFLFYFCSPSL